MRNRIVTISIGIIVVLLGLYLSGFLASQKERPERNDAGSKAPVVLVRKIQNDSIPNRIDVSGKLVARKRVELFSEVQGILLSSSREFKEGATFTQGEEVLKIDSSEYYLNLMAAKSSYLNLLVQLGPDIKYDFPDAYESWQAYVGSIDLNKPLPPLPETEDAKRRNFLTSRDVYNRYYTIKSQEEHLSKYSIYAPFNGMLSEGNLEPGAMIRVGQRLGTLIQPGEYELEAAVNANDASLIHLGDQVVLHSEDLPGEWIGTVKRKSASIDQTTQTLKVFVQLKGENLREGMYLTGSVITDDFPNAVEVPRELMVDLNKMYLVQDSLLILSEVNLIKIGKNRVVISGLKDGDVILNQVYSAAYNGMKVSPKQIAK
ncbi:HlyD family efflux transporter periplasmic adaptor subunit [bacterium SCSIO 12741]|nr:HlyD family efflux transporter periplasmic adaptor subunit [bacterium SCSIO 12741]